MMKSVYFKQIAGMVDAVVTALVFRWTMQISEFTLLALPTSAVAVFLPKPNGLQAYRPYFTLKQKHQFPIPVKKKSRNSIFYQFLRVTKASIKLSLNVLKLDCNIWRFVLCTGNMEVCL